MQRSTPTPAHCVAAADSERGQVFLVHRPHDEALELRVNGIFVMDTVNTSTERMLATAALDFLGDITGARVLLGGLGLGFTLGEVLTRDGVREVHVAEIEPAVIRWLREGLIPDNAAAAHDDRVRITAGDVREVLAQRPDDSIDLILLDVDNGPEYLVYEENSAVYRRDFLAACRAKLTARGVLAVWSADDSPALARTLAEVFGDYRRNSIPVLLNGKPMSYHLFLAGDHVS